MDGSDIPLALAGGRAATGLPQTPLSVGGLEFGRPGPVDTPRSRPLVTVGARRTMNAREFRLTAQVNAVALRLRSLMTGNAAAVLHVTAAAGGEGVSTVARELVHAAARMQWCKVLLLDGNPGGNDQSRALRAPLPDIVMGYAERSAIQVLAVESDGCEFHAALWPSNVSVTGISVVPVLGRLLHAAYDLIVLDCPPILTHPHLPAISDRASQVLLVIRSEESSVESVRRAKQEIEVLHGSVWGAVLTGKRRIVPGMLDRRF